LKLPNAKVAEHLAHSLHESSSIQEILQSMQAASGGEAGAGGGGGEVAVGKIHEFEIELERLQSKVDHLKAQVSKTVSKLSSCFNCFI